jgi:hypothetical protein
MMVQTRIDVVKRHLASALRSMSGAPGAAFGISLFDTGVKLPLGACRAAAWSPLCCVIRTESVAEIPLRLYSFHLGCLSRATARRSAAAHGQPGFDRQGLDRHLWHPRGRRQRRRGGLPPKVSQSASAIARAAACLPACAPALAMLLRARCGVHPTGSRDDTACPVHAACSR